MIDGLKTVWGRLGAAACVGLLLAGCGPTPFSAHLGPGAGKGDQINTATLNTDIDRDIGGLDTCVIMLDTTSGRPIYRYGGAEACMAKLPPCQIFDIPNSLIGLNQGVITPQTVFKWDGTPQPVSIWQTDANLPKAFQSQIGWWFQHLAAAIGPGGYAKALGDLDYGDRQLAGPATAFWMGPQAGGGLTVTEDQQADFMRRFYAGDLKIKPDVIKIVQGLTLDETRTDAKGAPAVINGHMASCATTADGSRTVGWWVGRLKTSQHDLSFSASIEGGDAPPGLEIERRLKDDFTDAGLLPPGSN